MGCHVSHSGQLLIKVAPALTLMQYPTEELDRQVDASVEERKVELLEPFDFISRLSSENREACETGVWRGKVDQLYLPESAALLFFSLFNTICRIFFLSRSKHSCMFIYA